MALTTANTYPIGGIALNGWVSTYSNLPATFTLSDAGKAYICQSDNLLYVWSGTVWPSAGNGFNLAGPVGPNGGIGPIGPANSLSIGTVVTGAPASATITGTAPSQVLSLVLPEGHWWTGTGAPGTIASSMDGDLYLDNSGSGNVYQLQSGVWVAQGTLKGPTGATGATGTRGSDWFTGSGAPGTVSGAIAGDFYLNTANGTYYSYNGSSWTSQGSLLGPTGATGPTGASSTWLTGSGVPSSGLGNNGDMYLNTSNGAIYGPKSAGAWGSSVANITGPAASDATSSSKGIVQLAGDLGGTAAAPTVPGKVDKLTPTAVKSSAYTAAVGDWVPCDASGGAFAITLPTAPADKSRIIVEKVDTSANAVTINRGGSDVFNIASGATTLTLALKNTSVTLQYAATPAIWYVSYANDLGSLDGRYAPLASPALTGTPTAPTASAGTSNTQIATTGFVATSFAPLASPALTGTPTVPTASAGTNTTQAASTAFVTTAVTNAGGTAAMNASKTSAYTAVAGDFVPCSASGGAFTVTLPTTPANGTRVTVMKTDTSTNAVTIASGGSDVINVAGTTQLKLISQFAVATLEYASAAAIWYNQEAGSPCKFTWLVQSSTRASGYGDMPEGIYFDQDAKIFAVQFRVGTADASGSNTIALYSNTTNAATGTAISSGSTTLTATSAGAKTTLTGPWSIAAGTYLQVNVTALGTTPGARLYCDVIGVYL